MNDRDKTSEVTKLNEDQIIALMGIYLNEWEHRVDLLWTQSIKLFYATLIVIVLPNIADFLKIDFPSVNKSVFPVIGMVMAVIFLYIGIGHAMRIKDSGLTYKKIMELLGNGYERVPIKELKFGWLFRVQLEFVLVITMFAALIIIAVVLLTIS